MQAFKKYVGYLLFLAVFFYSQGSFASANRKKCHIWLDSLADRLGLKEINARHDTVMGSFALSLRADSAIISLLGQQLFLYAEINRLMRENHKLNYERDLSDTMNLDSLKQQIEERKIIHQAKIKEVQQLSLRFEQKRDSFYQTIRQRAIEITQKLGYAKPKFMARGELPRRRDGRDVTDEVYAVLHEAMSKK